MKQTILPEEAFGFGQDEPRFVEIKEALVHDIENEEYITKPSHNLWSYFLPRRDTDPQNFANFWVAITAMNFFARLDMEDEIDADFFDGDITEVVFDKGSFVEGEIVLENGDRQRFNGDGATIFDPMTYELDEFEEDDLGPLDFYYLKSFVELGYANQRLFAAAVNKGLTQFDEEGFNNPHFTSAIVSWIRERDHAVEED